MMIKGSEVRKADYPIDNLFLDRWSPRAMSGEAISREQLMVLFEAARLGAFFLQQSALALSLCPSRDGTVGVVFRSAGRV